MILSIQPDMPPLHQDADGVVRIGGTRIPMERALFAFLGGQTAEQIAHDFDVLKVEDVYAVINYYLHHREEVDKYLEESELAAAAIQQQVEQKFDSADIRARLFARRQSGAS